MGVSGISAVPGGAPGDPSPEPLDETPADQPAATVDVPAEPITGASALPEATGSPVVQAEGRDAQADEGARVEQSPVPVDVPAEGDADVPDADVPAPAPDEAATDATVTADPVPVGPPAEDAPAETPDAPAHVDAPTADPLPVDPAAAQPTAAATLDADDVVRAAFASGPVVREPVWPVVPPAGSEPLAEVSAPAQPELAAPAQPEVVEPVRPVVPPVRYEPATAPPPTATPPPIATPPPTETPQASSPPQPEAPPRPTRAATRASAKAAAKSRAAAEKRSRSARRPAVPGGRPARRRRLWPVLLAAVLAVAVGAGAFLAVDLLGGRGDDPVAEPVPGAVLPELTEPAPALAELSAEAPAPDPTVLSGVLTPLLAAPALGAGLSAEVVDVASGEVLFAQAAEDPSTPASTAKLLTGLAVLTSLDPEDTLSTEVVAGAAPGEVVLVGGGDPTLSTTDPSTVYPGAATVSALADQVRQQLGGAPVTRVVVDNSLFTGPLTAPGWGPDDAPSTYAAPVTATAVDGARVDPDGNQRSGAPGTDAGAALAAALDAPTAEVVLGPAPAGARTLGTVESAPVRRLVEQALTDSDNLLTESLARHVALARDLPASFAGSAQAVTDAVADAGLDTTGLTLVDASGLSAQDRAPARLLVDVVEAASDGTVPAASGLLAGLPVAGYTGTLAERTVDGAVPGAVRAKTGTLLAVHDLAGTVLTADGRLLAFAVLADGAAGGPVASETALDAVAATLAGCGCR